MVSVFYLAEISDCTVFVQGFGCVGDSRVDSEQ